jgi:multiple sugar transport system ATP-binding protein
MAEIALRNIQKFFGDVQVIRDLNLTVADQEFVVLLGPSGCGKTTTLRAIAGLEDINSGDILIGGNSVQHLKASDRDIAFVFQLYALYPHMTVYENIAFPLRATRRKQAEIGQQVESTAKALEIVELLGKRPSALSGGDMQRVAIARALVRRPKALLMDEPIGALDAKLREGMRVELKRLHYEHGSTSIYVTHDQVEAMALADRIVIMEDGILQQVGTPSQVYAHPANLFVAQFVGSPVMNVVDANVGQAGNKARVVLGEAGNTFIFPAQLLAQLNGAGARPDSDLALGVRPEGVLIAQKPQKDFVEVEAHFIEPLGAYDIVDLKVGDHFLKARTPSGYVAQAGEKVWAQIDPAQVHFFDRATGKSLGIQLGG